MTSVRWDKLDLDNCCLMHLEPSSKLFKDIGKKYLEKLIAVFGTDHIYIADPFHEMTPISNNSEYLQQLSSSVFQTLADVDPKAIW